MNRYLSTALVAFSLFSTGFAEEKDPVQNTFFDRNSPKVPSTTKEKPATVWEGFWGGSALYWLASEEGLSIGRKIPLNRSSTTGTLDEKILYPDFQYRTGFQLFAGIRSTAIDGILATSWTRLHQTTSTTFDYGTQNNILPQTWVARINTTYNATKASSAWNLKFDLVDMVYAREHHFGKHLVVSPSVGVKAAWIDQDFNVSYHFTGVDNPMKAAYRSESWGVGPSLGARAAWDLGYGLCLNAYGDSALIHTSYTRASLEQDITLQTLSANQVRADYGSFSVLRPTASFGLGLGYGILLGNTCHLGLSASYDMHLLFNQNVLRAIADNYKHDTSTSATGDLTLHGLTLSAGLSY